MADTEKVTENLEGILPDIADLLQQLHLNLHLSVISVLCQFVFANVK